MSDNLQETIKRFERQGYKVELTGTLPIMCWLWLDDRIVGVGIDRSRIKAVERACKCLQEGCLL